MRKYTIIGTGGTGGAIGSYLAKAGKDVTFIARGNNLNAMIEKGLRVIRPADEFVIDPVKATTLEEYQGKADVIFVCVKGYSLEAIIPGLRQISDSRTIIIPILNIFGTGGEIQKYFPDTLVTDGCIYVAAQIKEPGCIQMNGDILRVIFGVRDKSDYREELKEIEADLRESGIEGTLSDNIARDALLKFSYVSPQGACGLYYSVSAGEIQKPGEIRECFAGLIREIDMLAKAMDIHFEEDIVGRNLAILDSLSPSATTSLQRDVASGKDSEIDGLIYEVVRLADRYGVDVPIYRKIAATLNK
ncbi:MAG: 2-dehydropantoate 2-reductase [Lachnospiraceae bacterium]|nr:2-dehydropantoate 2-reductase [Lachnospiraceae bacterium]